MIFSKIFENKNKRFLQEFSIRRDLTKGVGNAE